MVSVDFYAAFIIGLMGAGHCLGMCGGVSAAITLGVQNNQHTSRWPYLVLYNLGRIASYMIAGAIIGGAFANLASYGSQVTALASLRLLAATMMILLALYIGQWWHGVSKIEVMGKGLWCFLSPMATKLLPLRSPLAAIPFGALWGWLPCGLVYSTLSWAAVAGSATSGASVMLAFGLGTLPAMIAVGTMANQLQKWLKNLYFKRASALLLLAYGVHTGYIAIKQIM
ncbi:sulfite exporter TauE/SafE family protein [Photobacterium rosenbergii]|uniref:sulfite exporter TauE/SafE family protein n=1 Tax=Photobacterium rosenbergii TaxID=294936 RepID=UPI001C99C850|nr:sulfite exporter TauE/SafE family protein [Photobacterium rosenbergii]MBY5947026.1 sulfite exporter TauE/SafE family protein [Photobacterium rosenbergii]